MKIRPRFRTFSKSFLCVSRPPSRVTTATRPHGPVRQATEHVWIMSVYLLQCTQLWQPLGFLRSRCLGNMRTMTQSRSCVHMRGPPPPLGLLSSVSETGLGRALGGLPPTPWHTGLDAHAGLLCAELRSAIVPFCTPRGRQPREPFVTPAVLDAIAVKQHHRAALRQAGPSPATTLLQLFRDSCKAVRTLLRQAKRNYLEGLADDFEQASLGKDTAKLYRALKPFRTAGKKTNLRHVACVGKGDDLCHVPEDAHHVWETHFGGIEGGVVTSAEALVAKHRKAITRAVPQQTFPSLMDWERQFHGLARGKAPGADSLRITTMRHLLPSQRPPSRLHSRRDRVTGAEPLRWKGGLAFPLYKGKGVLLAEMLSKRYHKWIRSSLVPIFLHAKLPLHAGVAGHLSTGILSVSARLSG